jgi:hypothetical protein
MVAPYQSIGETAASLRWQQDLVMECSVLANSQHRWVREKQSYKKKLQKKHNILYAVQIF